MINYMILAGCLQNETGVLIIDQGFKGTNYSQPIYYGKFYPCANVEYNTFHFYPISQKKYGKIIW